MTILFVAAVILPLGCGNPSPSDSLRAKVGTPCTIEFRRGDALGGAGSVPVPPQTDSINGAMVSISGKLTAIDADWVVLDGKVWVPRSSILLIEFY